MSLSIRILNRSDAGPSHALRLRGLDECPSAFATSYEEECSFSISQIEQRLDLTDKQVPLGAFDDDEIVGMVWIVRDRHKKMAHKVCLCGIYVAPEARRKGVGRALVTECLAQARLLPDIRQVYLGVNAENEAALCLYESLGFEVFGREPACMIIDGKLHDELHMLLVLED